MKLMLRLALATVISAAAGVILASSGGGAPPPIRFDASPTEATGPAGASVTYHIKAYDPGSGHPISATCTGGSASGSGSGDFDVTSSFPVGDSTVHCDATLENGTPVSDDFAVTVTDKTPPALPQPPNVTASTTDPAGTAVNWAPVTATDTVDGSITAVCSPASGSTFPVGTTTVTCTATDSHGNSAQKRFTVTVTLNDTQAPTFTSVPGPISVESTGPSGAQVSYSVSATDNSGVPPTINCNPPSGSTFPIGVTTVNCTATDGSGNSASASFTVTVVFADHTAPVLTGVPLDRVVEANGPSGSIVNYPTPTATDDVDGPIAVVTCSPASGSTFPLGTTTVTCTATDSHGNTGSASFSVAVVDTTKPNLVAPSNRSVNATTEAGIPASDSAVAAFLSGATASDIVDPHPVVTNNAPAFFPVGETVVTFTATDASGNAVSNQATLDVRPLPPPGTPQPPPPPARKPPADVTNLTAAAGDARVRLSWETPTGVDHVVVTRTLTVGGDAQVVYTGSATSFTDLGVANGLDYRYVVVSVAANGDTSAGVAVVALPKRTMLRSPKDGARLRKAPKLVWFAQEGATYYNVQLFRGKVKILSAWPIKPALVLKAKWKYQGKAYRLTPDVYRWYVWPGVGPRSAVDYGELLGFFSFQMIR